MTENYENLPIIDEDLCYEEKPELDEEEPEDEAEVVETEGV